MPVEDTNAPVKALAIVKFEADLAVIVTFETLYYS
jgi:hypothetical protein